MPGVSTRISCPFFACRMPRMACRVVCGLGLVMATFCPTSALVSVDLPTLGRPTKETKPARKSPPPAPSAALPLPAGVAPPVAPPSVG
jgi:hypothetical protein